MNLIVSFLNFGRVHRTPNMNTSSVTRCESKSILFDTIQKLMIWVCHSCVILAQDLKTHDQLNIDNLSSVVSEDIVRQQRGFNPSVRCKPLLEMAKATANMGVFDDYIYRILAKECPTKKTLRYALRKCFLPKIQDSEEVFGQGRLQEKLYEIRLIVKT